jgi:WD40 repeat protein
MREEGTLEKFSFDDPEHPLTLSTLSGLGKDVSLSSDGNVLAAGTSDEIRIWTNAAPHLGEARWFSSSAYSAEFNSDEGLRSVSVSADGRYVAIGLENGLVRIVDTAHLNVAPVEFRGDEKSVDPIVQFDPVRPFLGVGSWDSKILFVPVGLPMLADQICARVWRNLSQAEWNQFVAPDIAYQRTCINLPPGVGAPGADDRYEPWKHIPNSG